MKTNHTIISHCIQQTTAAPINNSSCNPNCGAHGFSKNHVRPSSLFFDSVISASLESQECHIMIDLSPGTTALNQIILIFRICEYYLILQRFHFKKWWELCCAFHQHHGCKQPYKGKKSRVLWSIPHIGHSLWSPLESTTVIRVI